MKKLFVAALAVLGFAACSNDEVLDAPRSGAINFDNAFIDAATRAAVDPSTTTASIQNFDVWAFMNESDGTVFKDEDVQRNGNSWSYLNTQYWVPANTYYFAALSPMNSANVTEVLAEGQDAKLGLGTVTFENIDGTEDLLYAKEIVETNEDINIVPAPVKMQFQHLLSKVKFTFTNGFTTENASVVVRNITMTSPKGASINLAQADYSTAWELNGEEITLAFGDVEKLAMGASAECADERLTIPANDEQVYTVKFEVELFMGAQSAMVVEKTATIAGAAFEMGKAYNLTAEINPDNLGMAPIEFAVEVDEWDEAGDVATLAGTPVSSLEELEAFLAAANAEQNDGRCVFVKDITGNVTIEQKEGINIVIDGNNKTFNGTMIVDGKSSTTKNKALTIKNVNFATNVTTEMDFISSSNDPVRYARNVVIENCTFTAPADVDSKVVALRFRQAYNIVVKDCEMTGGHSFAQFTSHSGDGLTFEDITVESGRGINLGNAVTGEVNIVNCNIKATNGDAYGVRIDAKGANTMNVSGSTIEGYEPIVLRNAQSVFTFNIESTTLTATGDYQIVVLGDMPNMSGADKYIVYPIVTAVVEGEAELKEALANGESIVLTDDFSFSTTESNGYGASGITMKNGGVLDGNGHTLGAEGCDGTWDSAITTTGGTIKNIEIVKGFRGVFIKSGNEKVVLENVVFNGTTYTISCDQASNQGLEAYRCTFNGWTSYAATIGNVYFEECSFGYGAGYRFCRPYAPTAFVGCEFEAGFTVDPRAAVTFENCTIDGVALTVDNLSTLVTASRIANATVIE